MSYARMEKSVVELEADVKRLLSQAEATDEVEDGQHGKGQSGDELSEGLRFMEAKEALEHEVL